MKIEADSAQVKFPPPLAVLLATALCFVARYICPEPFVPEEVRWSVGAGLWVVGIGLMFSAVRQFRMKKTALPPWQSTSTIVVEGPYRFSRNPIYLSFLVMTLGSVFLSNHVLSFACLIGLFLFLRFYVIAREERYLEGKFGESYLSYKASSRRWI